MAKSLSEKEASGGKMIKGCLVVKSLGTTRLEHTGEGARGTRSRGRADTQTSCYLPEKDHSVDGQGLASSMPTHHQAHRLE